MRTMVHAPHTEQPLICCWDDCQLIGFEEHKVIVKKTRKDPGLAYVFCSDTHRDYFVHSHISYGNRG